VRLILVSTLYIYFIISVKLIHTLYIVELDIGLLSDEVSKLFMKVEEDFLKRLLKACGLVLQCVEKGRI